MRSEKETLIYLIEDDASIRRAIPRLLESLGYRVKVFSSATGFLEEESCTKSCIILDIHLEGMNGLDLQRYLVENGVRIPIVFITADDDEEIRRRVEETGAPFLRKPIQRHQLIDAIQKAVNSYIQ